MALTFLVSLALCGWCGNEPHRSPFAPRGPPIIVVEPPVKTEFRTQSQARPQAATSTLLNNTYYLTLAGLLGITVVAHPEHAFSLPYGPFVFVPAINILAGLYFANVPEPAAAKVKV